MRIAIFTELIKADGGGSQIAIQNLLKGLKSNKVDCKLFTIESDLAEAESTILKPFLFKEVTLDFTKAYKHLKAYKPDIILVNEAFSTFMVGLICGKLLNIKVIAFFHTYYHKNRKTDVLVLDAILERINRKYIKILLNSTAAVLTPSKSAHDYLTQNIKLATKVSVCHYPLFMDDRAPKTKDAPQSKIKLLYAGRFVKGKKVDLLINALSKVDPGNWRLTIIGGGDQEKHLINLTKKLNLSKNISFKPFMKRESLLQEYGKHDVFISFSDMETFGITYLEALYKGLILICADYDITRELFCNNSNVFLMNIGKRNLESDLSKILINILSRKTKTNIMDFSKFTYSNSAKELVKQVSLIPSKIK